MPCAAGGRPGYPLARTGKDRDSAGWFPAEGENRPAPGRHGAASGALASYRGMGSAPRAA
jgi:hypothetical protein